MEAVVEVVEEIENQPVVVVEVEQLVEVEVKQK